jgi:HEAT repeats
MVSRTVVVPCWFCVQLAITASLLIAARSAEDLGNELRSKDVRVRRQAAAAIRELGGKGARFVPALMDALQDSDRQVREDVIGALKNIKGPAAATVPHLIAAAKSEELNSLWSGIREAIIEIGAPATPHLLKEIASNGLMYRVEALGILEEIVLHTPQEERKRIFGQSLPEISRMMREKDAPPEVARILLRIDPEDEHAITILSNSVMNLKQQNIMDLHGAEVLARTRQKKLAIDICERELLAIRVDMYNFRPVCECLYTLGPNARKLVPLLEKNVRALQQHKSEDLLSVAAILFLIDPNNRLARSILKKQLPMLVLALSLPSPLRVLEVLGNLGPDAKAAAPAIERLMLRDNQEIRAAARIALNKILEQHR